MPYEPTQHWRELFREACRGSEYSSTRLASHLVQAPNSYSGGHEFESLSGEEHGTLISWKTYRVVFYILYRVPLLKRFLPWPWHIKYKTHSLTYGPLLHSSTPGLARKYIWPNFQYWLIIVSDVYYCIWRVSLKKLLIRSVLIPYMLVRSRSPSKSESDSSVIPYCCEMKFLDLRPHLLWAGDRTKTTIFNALSHKINNLLISATKPMSSLIV